MKSRRLFYLRALADLIAADRPAMTKDVAAALGVTSSAVTAQLKRLVELGLVEQLSARCYQPTHRGLDVLEDFSGTVAQFHRLDRMGPKRAKKAPATSAAPRPRRSRRLAPKAKARPMRRPYVTRRRPRPEGWDD